MFKRSFGRNNFRGGGFNRNRGGYSRGRRGNFHSFSRAQPIQSSRYINKAVEKSAEAEYVPVNRFEDFNIDPILKKNILNHGYNIPTPIQDQAINPVLAGKDVVGIANTGTGKTAAFLIPLIDKVLKNAAEKILIIVPTRELAMQISDELRAFSVTMSIPSAICIGGVSMSGQISHLRRSPSIIIGTPGRLKDLIMRRVLILDKFGTIVLDEVDRMVDIGFIKDIKYIVSLLPKVRQSLFFSATVSSEVNGIIRSFVTNPVTVSVKVKETAEGIDQDIIRVGSKNEKLLKLQSMLKQEEFKKVLIFGRTKWDVERLSKSLQQSGIAAGSIHGNKSQNQRIRALLQFKQNQLRVLVATDIAARGLDIEDVSHVINFDEPDTYNDYVHRIGRTGRANKQGKALTFVVQQNASRYPQILSR